MTGENAKSFVVTISKDRLNAFVAAKDEVEALDRAEVLKAIADAGVTFGLIEDRVSEFAASPSRDPVLIAEGLAPQRGVDDSIEVFFLKKDKGPDLDEGKVDYRETSNIVSVESGTLLVKRIPGTNGTNGTAVTGETIPAPVIKNIVLRAGKGASLGDDENQVFATVNGQPYVKESGTLRVVGVEAILDHVGDVCLKTGNLRFKGNVRVIGNVNEAMVVDVSGNVEITGLVTRATVNSGGKMMLRKTVIGSKIKAGYGFPGSKKLAFLLRDIQNDMQNLSMALAQLKERQVVDFKRTDFGRLILTLMDNRFKTLGPRVRHLFKEVAATEKVAALPEQIGGCIKSLRCLVGLSPLNEDTYAKTSSEMAEALDFFEQQASNPADITAHSVMTSVMQSTGSIHITGQGCVNTNLTAEGNVVVNGSFKGGEIYCNGYAEFQELGSELGVPPVVRVAGDKYIKASKVFSGAVLQIGQSRMVVSQETGSIKAKCNTDGYIEIL